MQKTNTPASKAAVSSIQRSHRSLLHPTLLASAVFASSLSAGAFAVGISDAKYTELGGSLSNENTVVRKVYDHLKAISLEPRFEAVGRIVAGGALCTATWLGNDGDTAFIITAAHCVAGDNKSQESSYTGQNISFRTGDGRLVASGVSTNHFIGYNGCESDLAILEVPLLTDPLSSNGGVVPKPIYADDEAFNRYVGQPMTLAGYGRQGTPGLGGLSSGRAYGAANVTQDVGGCLRNKANTNDAWAYAAPGDSGSTTLQWREGQFVGMGITSWWAGWGSQYSGHGRVAPHQAWVKRIFPNINTVTRSRTLTESNAVELKDVEANVKGTVYYLAGDNVSGPTNRKWAYPRGYIPLTVPMVNQTTGGTHNIVLRSQRQTYCGWGEINNGVYCYPSPSKGSLKVWYNASDNQAAPAGLYKSTFSLNAKGWHDHSYNTAINLNTSILVDGASHIEGTVTQSSAFTTVRYDNTVNGSVYYLSEGETTSDATQRVWNGRFNTWSTLNVPAVNRDTKEIQTVTLRASRYAGCGWTTMNNGMYCSNGAKYGQLRVSYFAEDNAALPKGAYDSLFNIGAKGWHSNFNKTLTFKLTLEHTATENQGQ